MPHKGGELTAISTLDEVSGLYDALLCDVWGVVHDGHEKSPEAVAALIGARERGLKVVLVTNSPRPRAGVVSQLDALDVSRQAYDDLVTSGDATQALIAEGPSRIFHIGPERDHDIFAGLSVELVGEEDAQAVVTTGLLDDEIETPDDYAALLGRLRERGVAMICANPDIVVHRGERLVYCAGALGKAYSDLGGDVRLAGKPHRPIYDVALRRVGLESPTVLCIGDGLGTDIKGAAAIGADALFIQEGIHRDQLSDFRGDAAGLGLELAGQGHAPRYVMPQLR